MQPLHRLVLFAGLTLTCALVHSEAHALVASDEPTSGTTEAEVQKEALGQSLSEANERLDNREQQSTLAQQNVAQAAQVQDDTDTNRRQSATESRVTRVSKLDMAAGDLGRLELALASGDTDVADDVNRVGQQLSNLQKEARDNPDRLEYLYLTDAVTQTTRAQTDLQNRDTIDARSYLVNALQAVSAAKDVFTSSSAVQ